jgi:hypothetical protein
MKVCLTTLLTPLRAAFPYLHCWGRQCGCLTQYCSSRMHTTLAPSMVCAGLRMVDFRPISQLNFDRVSLKMALGRDMDSMAEDCFVAPFKEQQ